MFLYLVQHGEARSKEEDPERSLTDHGRQALDNIRTFLDRHQAIPVAGIFHSGKLRAGQTAEILAAAIKADDGVQESDGLAPMDDPAVWGTRLRDMHQDVMLVGHLPHLSRLAGYLLCGDSSHEPIHFHNGGIVCLFRDADSRWTVDWVLIPGILQT